MPDIVEYCLTNVSRDARDRLPDEAEARPCLQLCGRCDASPFLVVDGEFVADESHDAILEGGR